MCAVDLEPASVWNPERRKARVRHTCQTCGAFVQPGEQYVSLHMVCDGSATTEAACLSCWADNETFGKADEHMMTNPSALYELLLGCVEHGEDGPTGEWAPMLARIGERQIAAQLARKGVTP